MVRSDEGAVFPADIAVRLFEALERLRACNLMYDMPIDVENACSVVASLLDLVQAEDLKPRRISLLQPGRPAHDNHTLS